MAVQLRTRLAIAGALLIMTTVATGVWSAISFRNVSRVVGETVAHDERSTDATSRLSSALEREDDAVLLTLSDEAKGRAELQRQRARVAEALANVLAGLDQEAERDTGLALRAGVDAYHAAIDGLLVSAPVADTRTRYHERVNPALRRAVAATSQIRDRHFRSSQAVAAWARDQATWSMQVVATISVVALILLIAIVLHLARVVMRPIDEMTRAVQAIRRGDFTRRVQVHRDDELGRLGVGFNRMADELEAFRAANIGEVIQAKETLEATLEALPDAVIVIDPDRWISAANPRARAAMGATWEVGLDDLPIPRATRDAVDAVLGAGDASEAAVDLARAIELSVEGRPRRLLPRIVPIDGARGAVLVLSDVTDLVRLDAMRLELVAVASHELRTPLTTMRMTLLMMQERAASYEPRDRELVATARLGVDQLAQLVDQFLDLTQIEAGQLRLRWTHAPLRDIVEQAARAIAPACDEAGIALEVDAATVTVAGDPTRLAMVVSNLLANAVKYTPPAGRITLRLQAAADVATIEVSDTGPGVPRPYRERVFERFFRVEHEQGGALRSGVGIGLYLARQVLEAHGGSIRCEEAAGGGARFLVTLPIARDATSG